MANRIFAGIAFVFSLIIYVSTMAPTTSFWDCGEFIACSYTLGVPHPPGTPLYLLIGNVFSNLLFFIPDVGARVNLISPIVSALSVMFLYLIIIELINKWFKYKDDKIISMSTYLSALIGSLLFAFTDSQWFNAVEAEVYGMSTFFTAIVVWLALRWSNDRGKKGNVSFIILISYLIGLAIGVHLLNLLAIPFIALILYFNITKDELGGFLLDNIIFYILGMITFIGFDILGFGIIINLISTITVVLVATAIQYAIIYFLTEKRLDDYVILYLKRISVLIVSGLIFFVINNGIIKGIPNMLNFFNSDSFSFWLVIKNFLFPLILIISLLAGLSLFVFIKNKVFKTSVISLLMIYIGFSTYILIPIRAIDNPNINENSPDSWKNFLSYMNRDQYGNFESIDWINILKYYLSPQTLGADEFQKLSQGDIFCLTKKCDSKWKKMNELQGSNISSGKVRDFDLNKKVFKNLEFEINRFSNVKDGEDFWINQSSNDYIYFDKSNHWIKQNRKNKFPNCELEPQGPIGINNMRNSITREFDLNTRVYQKINIDNSRLIESPNIQRWANFTGNSETGYQVNTSNKNILNFIWNYQVKEMYLRYFAWQFAGREYNDEEFSWYRNEGMSSIEPLSNIDWLRYGIPFSLIFGMIGMIYHFIRDPKRAFSVLILFIITGIAIILYLNQYDPQPRERDYSYVGSFFAFSIWIGIGCMALFDLCIYLFNLIKDKSTDKKTILIPIVFVSSILFGIMPLNHLINDYHYHDRKGNYAAWDYGYNLLNSCNPGSVLFTNGDNDTFPLWYVQEVDKVRTDVRVVNLSLLNTPWYINQIYNNNALGNIKFNFDEPIITESRYKQIQNSNTESLELPIFKYNQDYYIDLNNNNKHDKYDEQETLDIINNLEDPVTGTIYAYKRWDPVAWASIEQNYFKLEIMQSFEFLDEYNILKFIYNTDYETIIKQIDSKAKKEIHPNFDKIIDEYIASGNQEYQRLLFEYNFILTNSHFEKIEQIAKQKNKPISSYLAEYIDLGHGIYNSSECDKEQNVVWGKTPDKIGENYIFPISEYSKKPFNPYVSYQNETISVSQYSTLQNYFFRIQDIMILKIIEDIDKDRDVYFATTVNPESQMNLNQYLLNQGMVLKINSQKLTSKATDSPVVDREKLKENLFKTYQFRNLDNPNVFYNSDLQRILQNYRMLFLYLADEYRNPEDIKEILSYMNKVMPIDVIKIQRTGLQIYTADKYRSAGMTNDYNQIIEKIIDNNDIVKNIELADYLSTVDPLKSSELIKESLIYYKGDVNQKLKECLLSIDNEIKESINDKGSDILIKDVENIVYSIVTDNLIRYDINYYDDSLMIQALQTLSSNYVTLYSLLVFKKSEKDE